MDPSHPERDLESVHSEPKQTIGPEFYDRGNLSRRVGLAGIAVTALFSVGCICVGVVIQLSPSLTLLGNGVVVPIAFSSMLRMELFSLAVNLVVTACTEAIGFAHGTALRSSLASERRLCFHTNLRLLSAASGVSNPNGTLCNSMMAILLTVTYTSGLLVTVIWAGGPGFVAVGVHPVPLLVLGVALFLQAIVTFASVRSATILTWSSSPFDTTAALVHHAQILPELGRCMHGVADENQQGPVKPCAKQSSAWGAHKGVRRVVLALWLLVIICVAWGVIVFKYFSSGPVEYELPVGLGSWSFLRQDYSPFITYEFPLGGGRYTYSWIVYYVNIAAIQGPLTLALHCSELVVNLIRDEWAWRKATTMKGTTVSCLPLASVLGSPLNIALLACKPFLHWMLGLALGLYEVPGPHSGSFGISVDMFPFQIFNYSAALFSFSLALTAIVLHRPSGPQPAAYGHIQTLANLIDEWSPTMWWGHKYAGHAGTSDVQLGEVDMNAFYG